MIDLAALLKLVFLPPFGLFLLALLGVFLLRRHRRLGQGLLIGSLSVLYLLSTPYFGNVLLRSFQVHPVLPPTLPQNDVQAIVVLSGDTRKFAPEYGGDTVGGLSLARLRYGARLYRLSGLPVLVTGGAARPDRRPAGILMGETLEREFGVPVKWVESESRNTHENAELSASILSAEDIGKIYLVTHAWHMPRAKRAFESVGLEVVPAPMGLLAEPTPQAGDFIANARGLAMSYFALHEAIGALWYRFHYSV